METPEAEELETLETPEAEDPRDAEIERLKRQLAQNEADKEKEVAAEVQKRIDQSENPFSGWVVPEKEKHLYHLGIQRGEKFDQKTSKIIKSNFYVQSFNVPEFKQMQNLGNFAALKYVILHNPETEESEK